MHRGARFFVVMSLCLGNLGYSGDPESVISDYFEVRYVEVVADSARSISESQNDTERFHSLVLAISRGLLVKDRSSLADIRRVFSSLKQFRETSLKGGGASCEVQFKVTFLDYEDYNKKEGEFKASAKWTLRMFFSNKGVLENYFLRGPGSVP